LISGASAWAGKFIGDEPPAMKLYRQQFLSMGCPCEIGAFSPDPGAARLAIAEAEYEIHRLDRKYSHFRNDSYITRIQVAARQPGGMDVDAETSALLDYAATQFELSNGLFDITAGQLARLWHKRKHLPLQTNLDKALQNTGWTQLDWQSPHLIMPAGMQLELGGLVKEYAADRAAMLLKRKKMHSAFVELGGDIHVTGPQPDGKPWNMGIRKPGYRQQKNDKAIANIPVSAGGLATSGDYERSSLINGKHYGHIINPKPGWPVNSFQSVSVLAPSCLLAGSISTLAMLMGQEAGLAALRDSGLAWLAQTTDGAIQIEVCDTDVSGSNCTEQPTTIRAAVKY
jgi:thiamine biosynthesis lipoprotein